MNACHIRDGLAASCRPAFVHLAKVYVNTEAERFGSTTTIAHLAQYSFGESDSVLMSDDDAAAIIRRDWKWEIESLLQEERVGVNVLFKDGSELRVCAWSPRWTVPFKETDTMAKRAQ